MKHTILILLVGLSLLATACASSGNAVTPAAEEIPVVPADDSIVAEGRVEPLHYAEIAYSTSGVITEVLVEEGDRVKKGDVLIKLGDESDAQYAGAQLELVTARQALNDLQNTAGIDLARTVIDLKDAKEDFERAEHYLDYLLNSNRIPLTDTRVILVQTARGYHYEYKIKNFKGPAPEDWIIEARNDLALKKARFDELLTAYNRMKGGIDTQQLALLESRLDAARAGVAAFSVIAPFDGVVAEMDAAVGGSINAGKIAVTIADFSGWVVKTTDVTEIDVVNIAENQPVSVRFDAFPEVEMHGTVLSIAETYSESQGDICYEVNILLEEAHPDLRWGMTASVSFIYED